MGKGINFLEGGPGKVVEVDLTENKLKGICKTFFLFQKNYLFILNRTL